MGIRKLNPVILSIILIILFFNPLQSFAHDMRPALLQIKQIELNEYNILWKIPRKDNQILAITPEFPTWFILQKKNPPNESGTGELFTYNAFSKKDIHGMFINITGLETSMVDVLIQVELLNGEKYSMIIQPGKKSTFIPTNYSVLDTVKGYLLLGIKHILWGIDHLLFVLALLLITKSKKRILITVTAFTIAHSITLSLSALGQISLPGPPVEAVIALSILFLALEILQEQQGLNTITSQKPWIVAFIFGLLHGLGFASALTAVGLPQQHIPLALAFFNIGVEFGQLIFILVMLVIINFINQKQNWSSQLQKLPAYFIGCIAAFWLIERVIGFWN